MEIKDPAKMISGLYFSWERYFTQLLAELSNGFANNYSKSVLNDCYYKPCCCKNSKVCNIEPTVKKKEVILGKYLENEDDKFLKRKTQKLNLF